MLRKLLLAATLPLMLLGCSKLNDLTSRVDELDSRLSKLETICTQMNNDITSLQTILKALEDKDYVTSVEPVTEEGEGIGYRINFTRSGSITIFHGEDGEDGADGLIPIISVKKDTNGLYYWTLDGEWLLDANGNRIKASATDGSDGITPKLKIEDNWWCISYDEGQSWTKLSTARGDKGGSMFSAITYDRLYLYLTLADGTLLSVPMSSPISLEFDIKGDEATISAGETIVIGYTVTGSSQTSRVSASSDGNYVVKVRSTSADKGTIEVTAPQPYTDGYINVLADNGNGYTRLYVINFSERKLNFPEGLEYSVSSEGGTVEIPFTVNFDYTAKVATLDAGWLSIVQTKAEEREDSLTIVVTRNDGDDFRTGKVYIQAEREDDNGTHVVSYYQIISIVQSSDFYFNLDKTQITASAKGGKFLISAISTENLKVTVTENSWCTLSANKDDSDATKFDIDLSISENDGDSIRNVTVNVLSDDEDSRLLGTIDVVQFNTISSELNDLVFGVSAKSESDNFVYLPLSGDVDCVVDWGDGTSEHITSAAPSHQYDVSALYEVRVSGKVTEISSHNIKNRTTISSVRQWGNTGLTSMSGAFAGNTSLSRIPADITGSFAEVENFSGAFRSCTSLLKIPDGLFRYSGKAINFNHTFIDCSNLAYIPDNLFSFCRKSTSFGNCFKNCSRLKQIPENMFSGCTAMKTASGLFCNCYQIKSIPAKLFYDTTKITSFNTTFYGLSFLESVPEGLFDNCPNVQEFSSTFYDCQNLQTIPVSLFDNNRKVTNFSGTFGNCLKVSGESPYTIVNGVKYHLYERANNPDEFTAPISFSHCFRNATFSDSEQIQDSWK